MKRFGRVKFSLIWISLLIGLVWLVSGCGGQQPAVLVVTPSIGEPKVGAPSPQQPGEEIGISIEIASTGGATLSYTWAADGGEIVRGQGSPAITYRVPKEPGTYNIRVKVEWDGQSVEKVTSVKVEGPNEAPTPEPPTDTSQPPVDSPTPKPTDTPEPTNTPKPPTATSTPVPTITPTPTPHFVTRLTIPSDTNLGITYNIEQTGLYTFQYADSAVAAWFPDDSDKQRWHTKVWCFRSNKIEWAGETFSGEALFGLGSGMYASPETAIEATRGAKATARLNAGEQLTCVIEDGFSAFYDNSGEVIWDVFLSP